MRILIVDDEPQLLKQLSQGLSDQRYEIETAVDGEEALDRIFAAPFDLILLDIMLPKRDGLSVLNEIRQANFKTPVLMLTAKNSIEDKITGLDQGADDYLAKPFSMAELMARVRALLRRDKVHGGPVLKIRDLQLNTITREVTRGGPPINLTPKEFSIIEFLMYNKNRAVSRFNLAEHVWGEDFDPFSMSNYIDVHMRNLRRKIGDTTGSLIHTIRGIGYIIMEKNNEDSE
jgi:DNA-binding response OmpR family regulator